MSKATLTIQYEAGEPVHLKDLSETDERLLRRVIEICREAKEAGNYPFGCLLADRDGNILMEQGNCENEHKGDCTGHAETELMRRASQVYTKEEMWDLTMYNCGEPCAMCSGAIYWGNLGRLVYIGRESTLKKYTGDDPYVGTSLPRDLCLRAEAGHGARRPRAGARGGVHEAPRGLLAPQRGVSKVTAGRRPLKRRPETFRRFNHQKKARST